MKIEILHVRNPDGGCDHTLFVDGELVMDWRGMATHDVDISIEDVDAGRGYTRADWDESTQWFLEQNPHASAAFNAAVVAARQDPPGKQYIDEGE